MNSVDAIKWSDFDIYNLNDTDLDRPMTKQAQDKWSTIGKNLDASSVHGDVILNMWLIKTV